MPLKAVLCDLDNTLFDRDHAFRRWADDFIHATLGLRGHTPCEEARDLLVALDAHGYGPKPAMFATLAERYPTLDDLTHILFP